MKTIALAIAMIVTAAPAYASCQSDAADKRLAGAALKSFMTKCERDAKTTCNQHAVDMKLAGAAKNSHINKCVKDAVGG
jgi:hypothetical protein